VIRAKIEQRIIGIFLLWLQYKLNFLSLNIELYLFAGVNRLKFAMFIVGYQDTIFEIENLPFQYRWPTYSLSHL
jgi:hypothetical protein